MPEWTSMNVEPDHLQLFNRPQKATHRGPLVFFQTEADNLEDYAGDQKEKKEKATPCHPKNMKIHENG
jgi:hypothetical protein